MLIEAPSRVTTATFATAVAVCVLGLYAPQALVQPLSHSFGGRTLSGEASTLSLLGYAMGLLFLVPIVDLGGSRTVILTTATALAGAFTCAALAPSAMEFGCAIFLAGVCASVIQMLVPTIAALTPPVTRGRVIGDVMSGLMLGIMLSRPLASFVSGAFGWRSFYAGLAGLVCLLTLWLGYRLPALPPKGGSYLPLLASLARLLRREPELRRRALSQALLMAAFNCFWGSVALRLATTGFGLGAFGIGVFAFAAAGGIVSAPIAGRAADSGRGGTALIVAHISVVAALLCALEVGQAAYGLQTRGWMYLGLLALATLVLDAGVIADQTIGRRAINLLDPAARGRLNGLYTGLFFLGSSAGAAISGIAWARGGWLAVCGAAAVFALAAMLQNVLAAVRSGGSDEDILHTP